MKNGSFWVLSKKLSSDPSSNPPTTGEDRDPGESEERRKNSLISRDAKLLFTWLFINSIPIGYMNVVPLVYLLEVGYSPALIGTIYAVAAVANTLSYFPCGILADRYGRKVFVLVGGLIPCISYAIFGLTLNPILLILAGVLGGVGLAGGFAVGMSSPAILPLLAESTSDKNRTMIFGLSNGIFIGALTTGALLSFLPSVFMSSLSVNSYSAHSYAYFVMSILVIASTIPVLFVKERRAKPPQLQKSATKGGKPSSRISRLVPIVSRKTILNFSIIFAFSGFGLGVIVQLVPTWYTIRFGVNETTAGLAIAVAEFCGIFAILIIPSIVKRRGTIIASAVTLFLSCAFLGIMPLAATFMIAAILFVFRSIFINVAWPVQQSYMVGIVKEKERATAIGITYSAWGAAASLATYIGGTLLSIKSLTWLPFVLSFAAYSISALLLYLMFRKIKPPEELELDPSASEVKMP